MKRAWLAVVFAVAMVTAIAAPTHTAPMGVTTPVAQAAGPPTQVLGLTNLIGALFRRQRVYNNAAEVQNEIRAYYDELVASAKEAVSEGDLSITDEQLKAYIRIRAALEVEKNAALQLLEDDKRGARRAFQNTLNQEIPSLLLAIPGIRDAAQVVQGDLGESARCAGEHPSGDCGGQAVGAARPGNASAEARPVRSDHRCGRWRRREASWRRHTARSPGRSSSWQQVPTAPPTRSRQGSRMRRSSSITALSGLEGQLRDDVRPVTIDMGAFQVRIPGQYVFYAAVADALSAHGGRQHGLTRDAMRDRVRQFLIDTKASEFDRLKDCYTGIGRPTSRESLRPRAGVRRSGSVAPHRRPEDLRPGCGEGGARCGGGAGCDDHHRHARRHHRTGRHDPGLRRARW